MNRLAILPLVAILAACPGEKAVKDTTPVIPLDTTSTDLSNVQTSLPPPAPDTFTIPKPRPPVQQQARVPDAPSALVEAVQREQSATKFCFSEFGQKADPSLVGNVAMVVTVGDAGISDATVAASNWSGAAAGKAVNKCLNEKAKLAWKLPPGSVKQGKYQVQLSFRGT